MIIVRWLGLSYLMFNRLLVSNHFLEITVIVKFIFKLTSLFLLFCIVYSLETNAKIKNEVIASINGTKIFQSDIESANDRDVYEARKKLYDLEIVKLRQKLISMTITLDPKSNGLSNNQYLSRFVIKPISMSDAEVNQFIINANIPREKINTNLKEQVRTYLIQQLQSEQVEKWFEKKQKEHKVVINLEKPAEPRTQIDISGSAYRGGKNAKVTIVEFSDFQCPYCEKADVTLQKLSKIYGDKIKIVYKHFPLESIHKVAKSAGAASICAQEQGMDKFWLLHDAIFENYGNLSVGLIKDLAKKVGLNTTAFNQCVNSGKNNKQVERDIQQGLAAGVQSTPAFFINGRYVKGALPVDAFKNIIDEELDLR